MLCGVGSIGGSEGVRGEGGRQEGRGRGRGKGRGKLEVFIHVEQYGSVMNEPF